MILEQQLGPTTLYIVVDSQGNQVLITTDQIQARKLLSTLAA